MEKKVDEIPVYGPGIGSETYTKCSHLVLHSMISLFHLRRKVLLLREYYYLSGKQHITIFVYEYASKTCFLCMHLPLLTDVCCIMYV